MRMLRVRKEKELYQQGMSVPEIAAIVSVEPSTVWKDLKEAGVEIRPKKTIESHREQIIALYKEGKSFREISCIIGVSSNRIWDALVKWGCHEVAPTRSRSPESEEALVYAKPRQKFERCTYNGKKYVDIIDVCVPR